MRFYGVLLLYLHCFLSFCVMCLFWKTRSQRIRPHVDADAVTGFATLLTNSVEMTPPPKTRMTVWKQALLSSIRRDRIYTPSITSDELSASVSKAIVFGEPTSLWVEHMKKRETVTPQTRPHARVLALHVVAPGASTDTFWQTIFAMQQCGEAYQMLVLLVVVGPLDKQTAVTYQHWTRDLVVKADMTQRGATDKVKDSTNRINLVTIVWMQGPLQSVLREAMAMAEASNVVDTVIWLHPAMQRLHNMCELVFYFSQAQYEDTENTYQARCLDEVQLKHYEVEPTQLASRAVSSAVSSPVASPASSSFARSWSTHECNIVFPLRTWASKMKLYSTLDMYGVVDWHFTTTTTHHLLVHSVVVMPVDIF
jgi:hypothetical protein